MRIAEYTISYQTKENPFGDVIYHIPTKKQALKEANQLKKQGATSVWIDIHGEEDGDFDIIGDIKIV